MAQVRWLSSIRWSGLPVAQLGWPLLALALSGTAFAQTPTSSATVPVCTSSAAAAAAGTYLQPAQLNMTDLLAAPPLDGSEAARRDLAAVLEVQRTARAHRQRQHAIDDAATSCGRFEDALGAPLSSAQAAPVLAFLNHAAREGSALSGAPKQYWHRRRPYAVDPSVERLADVAPDAPLTTAMRSACGPYGQLPSRELAEQALARVSYPSGHATFGTVCAILLANMVPEKRRELFARAQDYGRSRLIVGAHFPSDIEAGRIVGTVAVALMRESAQFQHDFAAARAQLRSALGLPTTSATLSNAAAH